MPDKLVLLVYTITFILYLLVIMKHIYQIRTGRICIDTHDICRVFFDDKAEVKEQDIDEIIGFIKEKNLIYQKISIIVDIRKIFSLTKAAREKLASHKMDMVCYGIAFLVDSKLSWVIGNFTVGFSQSAFPMKLFSSEEAAVEWLGELKRIFLNEKNISNKV